MTLPIVEVFGPTIQGEGPYAGHPADFVRFGGCNLSCSWCDSAFTWDASRYNLAVEIRQGSVGEIVASLSRSTSMVVLTGGEPLLYAHLPDFAELLRQVRRLGRPVHVESNGTRAPGTDVLALVDVFVLSPKLANAGQHRGRQDPRLHPSWRPIAELQEVHLKYVCEGSADVELAVEHANSVGWSMERVWVMPQATDRATLDERWVPVVEAAARLGVNATSRLHILAWGDERGR